MSGCAISQQIAEILVVDLHERRPECPVPTLLLELLRLREDLRQGPRDQAPRAWLLGALHRESLPRPGLTVGEYADLVTIERRLHKRLDLFEDFLLRGARAEDAIEREGRAALLAPVEAKL